MTGLLLVLLMGCDPVAEPVEPVEPVAAAVDAGDEAWVRRAVPLLWGRGPRGIAEVALLTELVEASDRATAVRTMAGSGAYRDHWQDRLYNHLRVNRADIRANPECYARFGHSGEAEGPELAAWVRDHPPSDVPSPSLEQWTVRDLVHSSLRLDDLSGLWRAQLFAQLAQDFEASDADNAREVQQNLAEIFESQALGRNLDCLPCHNSEWSITGHEDPARDRTWEVPGHFEQALFGSADGMDRDQLNPFFRRRGVLHSYLYPVEELALAPPNGCQPQDTPGCDGCACEDTVCAQFPSCCTDSWGSQCTAACADSGPGCVPGAPEGWEGCEPIPGHPGCPGCACETAVCNQLSNCCLLSWDETCSLLCADLGGDCEASQEEPPGHRPWGMHGSCGRFYLPHETEPDPLGRDARFVGEHGTLGTAWELEAALAEGVERLRGGFDRGDELSVEGTEAFAYLTVLSLANAVWTEAFGAALTVAHDFPRNQAQRDQLVALGDVMLEGGFSLVEVLVAITAHPAFNAAATEAGQPFPPVFDPWTPDTDGPPNNGPGELVRHRDPRTLMTSAADALGWVPPAAFVDAIDGEAYDEQERLGFFLKDSVHGFSGGSMQWAAAWELAVGACASRANTRDGCAARSDAGCDGCSCETFVCQQNPHCCTDRWTIDCATACRGGPGCSVGDDGPGQEPDHLDAILAAEPTIEGALITLKDLLLADPSLADWERELFADLTGAGMDDPVDPNSLRRACGLLLATPQFLLVGDPGPDRIGSDAPQTVPGRERSALCAGLADDLGIACQDGRLTL